MSNAIDLTEQAAIEAENQAQYKAAQALLHEQIDRAEDHLLEWLKDNAPAEIYTLADATVSGRVWSGSKLLTTEKAVEHTLDIRAALQATGWQPNYPL